MGPGFSVVSAYAIRPYRPGDRAAVRRICIETAWLGRPGPRRIGDGWVWAEYWTRYYTDREQDSSWVVAGRHDGRVAGYLTGTADAARVERYVPFLLPGIVWRVVRKRLLRRREPRGAILSLLASAWRGETNLSARVLQAFPATFHVNLLPAARGQGLGSVLLETFLARMRRLGVPGVHATPSSVNRAIAAALARAGFRRLSSRPTRAFAHVDARPMTIDTWAKTL